MSGKAKKPTRQALQRWETEGGAKEDEPQPHKTKRDASQLSVVDIGTGRTDDREPTPEEQDKGPSGVNLGRRDGLKSGKASAARMTPARRAQIAKAAAKARWNKR
jgi:hypothetical protein